MFKHIEMFLNSRGAVMIHATGDPKKIWKRIAKRGDTMIDYLKPNVPRVVGQFQELSQLSWLPVLNYRIPGNTKDFNAFIKNTTTLGRKRARMSWRALQVTTDIIGEVDRPSVLLVGDEAKNELDDAPHPIPFGPFPATSGAYLMNVIYDKRTAITNAFGHDGTTDLGKLWDVLGTPPVVALGNNAHEELTRQGVRHGVVPHPQYVRRFFNKHDRLYRRAIENARNGSDQRAMFRRDMWQREALT